VRDKHRLDPLKEHTEWVEHMYNPGYWVNRVTSRDIAAWKYARRHAVLNGLIGTLVSALCAFALAYPAIEESRRAHVGFLRIMFDEFTIWPELFFLLMFVGSSAFLLRGILDRIHGGGSPR